MKIGIDISQLAYQNTGVANYLKNLVENLINIDTKNEYVLFYSSMRRKLPVYPFMSNRNVIVKHFRIPPKVLNLLWNRLHVLPIEGLIGDVDVFLTSDWAEPPVKKAKKATILYDLVVLKYPKETDKKIVRVQKKKLKWVQKESDKIICISNATKNDAKEILGISEDKLSVAYPGV